MSAVSDLTPIMSPRSIAVIGASGDRRKNSGKPLNFLREHGYEGAVYPINPRYSDLLGWKCYASVLDVPDPIELAVIALPAEHVGAAIAACGEKGIKGAVILTSGFSEVDERGRVMEQEIAAIAGRYGIRLCGPNSVGLINAETRAIASFSQAADGKNLRPGGMALVSQSGNFGTFMIELAARRNIAFSHFVSTGNETDLGFVDYAEHLVGDPVVRAVVGYIEGLRDPRRLRRLGELAKSAGRPIVVVKVGRSTAAARSAMSHTGAIVGDDRLYDVAFRQAGILRVEDEEEALDVLPLLMAGELPRGRRVAIVSISGGGATMMADACDAEGLEVPEFNASTQASLRKVVPYFGMVKNPVDLTGQVLSEAGLMRQCLEAALHDENVDAVVVFLSLMERLGPQVAKEILDATTGAEKPIVVSWIAGPPEPIATLRAAGMCVTTAPAVACARALGHAVRYASWRGLVPKSRKSSRQPHTPSPAVPHDVLSGAEARVLLDRWGLPLLKWRVVENSADASIVAADIGFPVALKLERPVLAHKTEANALRLGLDDRAAVAEAARALLDIGRSIDDTLPPTLLVEAMAPEGVEMILSLRRDRQFGNTLNIGLGGVHAEIYRDVVTRLLPVGEDGLAAMLDELRGQAILRGYRGKPAADLAALVQAMRALCTVAETDHTVELVEINPLIVWPAGRGAAVADALVKRGTAT